MLDEKVTIREIAGVKIIDINHANLVSTLAYQLKEILDDLINQNTKKIAVNMSRVRYINSASIGALVRVAGQLRENDGDLKIFGLAGNPRHIFDLIGASTVVEIYESEEATLAVF